MVGIYARGLHDEEMFVVQWEKIVTRGWKLMTRDGLSDALIRCLFFVGWVVFHRVVCELFLYQ